jgi:hypothetical protein
VLIEWIVLRVERGEGMTPEGGRTNGLWIGIGGVRGVRSPLFPSKFVSDFFGDEKPTNMIQRRYNNARPLHQLLLKTMRRRKEE